MAPVRKYGISSHGRWRMAHRGKIRTVKAQKRRYATIGITGLRAAGKSTTARFHCLQGAAFPEICGRLTTERPTWDHKSNDRDDSAYMHATNLRPANRSEQALNQTTSDNWIEGRPCGSEGAWTPFRNPGRAVVELCELEPGKNFDKGGIWQMLRGQGKQHQGWEFRFQDPDKVVRIVEPETPRRKGETWRALVLPGGKEVPQCEVSDQGRYRNSRGRTYTPTPARGTEYASITVRGHSYKFHNLVAATFEDIIGAKPGDTHTIGHQDIRTTNNKVSNLRWEDRETQALNKSTSDNWIEGRPYSSQKEWVRFRNTGRAAVELCELEPSKNWGPGNIVNVLSGHQRQHHGWEFRYVDPDKAVRKVTSAPSEPQWCNEPEFADEQWARLEPLGDWRLCVTPEFRDGTEGASFVVDLHEFLGASESDSDSDPDREDSDREDSDRDDSDDSVDSESHVE